MIASSETRGHCRSSSIVTIFGIASLSFALSGCGQSTFTAQRLLSGKLSPSTLADSSKTSAAKLTAAMERSRQLRIKGRKPEALSLLNRTAKAYPDNKQLSQQRALLSLEVGQVVRAEKLLISIIASGTQDWRLHSGLGTALATQGKHRQAQSQFKRALKLAPGNPAVLNNLALSYAMDGKLPDAEKLLRKVVRNRSAVSQVRRAKQNLALILGFRGKLIESRRIGSTALPIATADANIKYLKHLSRRDRISRAIPLKTTHHGKLAHLPQNKMQ